jgi:diguanylate cyclase (GGDEF)-like protein/PAS domain S-box-containing protein
MLSLHQLGKIMNAEDELTKGVVLVVDDESLNRFLISEALANDHYCIVEMDSGEAAVTYMTHHSVDLILLDIDMPGMGGLAACEAIRALPNGTLVPIAMVTGFDDNASIERAFEYGATDFLTKPVNWTLMRQRVRFMLRHGNITRELRRNEQILEQVHEIARIGHWQWDFVNHTIYLSEQYRRILPGSPAQLHHAFPDHKSVVGPSQPVLAEIARALDSAQPGFNFECSLDLPQRGKRHLLYHGSIEYSEGKPLRLMSTVQDITERFENEERFAAIFNESPVGIIEADCSKLIEITQQLSFANATDEQLRTMVVALLATAHDHSLFIKANPAAERILPNNQHHPLLHKLRSETTFHFFKALRDNNRHLIVNCRLPVTDDTVRDIIITAHLPTNLEDYKHFVISISDVTDLNRREAQLKRADAIITNSRDAIAASDKNSHVFAINPAYTRIAGYALEEAQTANLPVKLIGHNRDETIQIIRATLKHQDYWRGEVEHQHRNGTWLPALMQLQIIRNEHGEADGFVTITSDISEIKESEKRLYQLAHYDALTSLPNRLSLQERLHNEFKDSEKTGNFCLLYIDLDGFKFVNDSMGHPTGDTLLREVSARLSKTCRPSDLFARIGGDEFALLMFNGATTDEIDVQATRIFNALKPPFIIDGREIFIGASIGACRHPEDAINAEDMLRNADSAMYEAKRLGRAQLCYYSADLTSVSNHRLQIESELRVAISSDQLFLMYQPKYDAATGCMVGAEALVRWRSPHRGVVPPGEFIGIAEASGLIIPLGEWVIHEACRQLAEWRHKHGISLPVAINISALHLRDDSLPHVIREALEYFAIDPQLLEIEITEDSLDFRGEDERPYAILNRLSQLGLAIAIDDFGTGYSSLSQLKKMPISTLKIDGSFVRDIASDESDHAIIAAIVGLAKTLEMKVVAEGVEREEQAQRLRTLECDVLQGFLFAKPLPPEELLRKFRAPYEHNKGTSE